MNQQPVTVKVVTMLTAGNLAVEEVGGVIASGQGDEASRLYRPSTKTTS